MRVTEGRIAMQRAAVLGIVALVVGEAGGAGPTFTEAPSAKRAGGRVRPRRAG